VRVASLDELHSMHVHRVEVEFASEKHVPEDTIRSASGVENVDVHERTLTCTVRGDFQPFLSALDGARVTNLVSREPSLEEFFLEYYREGEGDELAIRP
jgi:ABC-2 type transport system ATP-binding protein